tara:strand:- start:1640 stop:2296 length:657 start_codon:yes stop_codon:yes gene_type:complete
MSEEKEVSTQTPTDGDDTTPVVEEDNSTLITASDTVEETSSEEVEKESPAKDTDSKTDVAKTEGAPESYEAFDLPEGFELSEEFSSRFTEAAKDMNLSQDQAQFLINMQTDLQTSNVEALAENWTSLKNEWQAETKKDKEIGGKEFSANLGVAKQALEKFGTPELSEAVELTGMGNHPEFIRLLYRVGKTLKEDKVMVEGANTSAPVDRAKVLFPDMN